MIGFEIVLPQEIHADLIRVWRNDPRSLEMSNTYTQEKTLDVFFPEFLQTYFSISSLPPLFALLDGKKVGVLRFDPADSRGRGFAAEISILVAPEFRNQGLAAKILLAIEPFLKRQGVSVILAQIKKQNAPSIQAFTKAGYQFLRESNLFWYEKILRKTAEKVFIIAEAGSNWHANDAKGKARAFELIEKAKEAGADAIKFQTFRADETYVSNPGMSDYLAEGGIQEDIADLFSALTMPDEMILEIASHAKDVGIEFISSVFSERAFHLIDPLVKRHKIASYEISHLRLLELAGQSGKPLILSTGAATPSDIDWAVNIFRKNGGTDLTLLQCTAKYPAPLQTLNLNVIPWLKQRYQTQVGLSDHSLNPILAPLSAVSLGASVVEKHYTLDRSLNGPDHPFSIEPHELKSMVHAIRETEAMLGSSVKKIEPIESELYLFARRGVQATRLISEGEILLEGVNMAILRPGKRSLGIHPRFLPFLQGKQVLHPIPLGEGIQIDNILI